MVVWLGLVLVLSGRYSRTGGREGFGAGGMMAAGFGRRLLGCNMSGEPPAQLFGVNGLVPVGFTLGGGVRSPEASIGIRRGTALDCLRMMGA